MERCSQRHCVDRHQSFLGEDQGNDFHEAAGSVRSDEQQLRWIGLGVEVSDDDGMVTGVQDVIVGDAVLACRSMNFHTGLL